MRTAIFLALLSASVCWAQLPQEAPAPQAQAAQSAALIIPAGTMIPARLINQITVKSRPGDAVRAETAFPVTVGTRVAIPAGSYLEGEIVKLNKRDERVQMRFTRLVYANGYSVDVVGEATQPDSSADNPILTRRGAPSIVASNGFVGAQQNTTPPALSPPQSHTGLFIGLAVASAAVAVLLAVLLGRHHGYRQSVLFDTGWQFEVVLKAPVTVDAARIADLAIAPAVP